MSTSIDKFVLNNLVIVPLTLTLSPLWRGEGCPETVSGIMPSSCAIYSTFLFLIIEIFCTINRAATIFHRVLNTYID